MVSLRGGDFLFESGQDLSLGYDSHDGEIVRLYADFAETELALPVVRGEKTAAERFAGAVATYSIEALMPDGKAQQSGTSHFLGQNFAEPSTSRSSTRKASAQTSRQHIHPSPKRCRPGQPGTLNARLLGLPSVYTTFFGSRRITSPRVVKSFFRQSSTAVDSPGLLALDLVGEHSLRALPERCRWRGVFAP